MTDNQASTQPRRFVRSRDGRMLAGVFSGLGTYTGTDPTLWRLGFVAVAICTGGMAVIAYVAAALIVPEAPR